MRTATKRWLGSALPFWLTVLASFGVVAINRDGGPCTSGYGYFLLPFVLIFGVLTFVSVKHTLRFNREEPVSGE